MREMLDISKIELTEINCKFISYFLVAIKGDPNLLNALEIEVDVWDNIKAYVKERLEIDEEEIGELIKSRTKN